MRLSGKGDFPPKKLFIHAGGRTMRSQLAGGTLVALLIACYSGGQQRAEEAPKPKIKIECDKEVYSVAWHPDGKTIGILQEGGLIRIHNVFEKRDVVAFDPSDGELRTCREISFSSDGRMLAVPVGHDGEIWVFEAFSGKQLFKLKGHGGTVFCVAFSRDGRLLASSSLDGTAKIWDVSTRKEKWTLRGHKSFICSVAFSPDGKTLTSASHDDTVKVWNTDDGQEKYTLPCENNAVSTAITLDGRYVLSGSREKTVRIWDLETGKAVRTLVGHRNTPFSITCSSNPRIAATGDGDGAIILWDIESGKQLARYEHVGGVHSVDFSADGRLLVSGSADGTVRLWDTSQ